MPASSIRFGFLQGPCNLIGTTQQAGAPAQQSSRCYWVSKGQLLADFSPPVTTDTNRFFSTIHLEIFTWVTATSHPACHQSGLGFGNISNWFCYRKNGVLEPTSPFGFLHVVSAGDTVGNACQHHRRYMAVRSAGFQQFCCRENEKQQQLYSSSRASAVLTPPAPILGLSSTKAPFWINWSVLYFSLTQLFSTATDDCTWEGM